MYTEKLSNILSELKEIKNREHLSLICEDFCKSVDIPYYLFGIIDQSSLFSPIVHTFSNYPKDWLEIYFKQNNQSVDPVVNYIMFNQSPIRWDLLVQCDEYQAPEQLELMQVARQYGLSNGFTVPIRSMSGDFALFSMAIGDVDAQCEKLNTVIPVSHTFATHLIERYHSITKTDKDNGEISLTKRETECLFWGAEGKTAWEISKIINISERTVLFHLNNSIKKLCASNRQHAVALAIKKGLLKPNIGHLRQQLTCCKFNYS